MKTISSTLVNIVLILCYFYCNNIYSQTISNERAFFYFVKIYKYSVSTKVESGGGYSQCGGDLLTHYAYVFDNYNYLQSRNDEFEKNKYTKTITSKFLNELAKVKFEDKFTVSCEGSLGEYSFENSSFPINFTKDEYRLGYDIPFYKDDCYMIIRIGEINNLSKFKWNLPFPIEKAQDFISKRKDADGKIDRTICFNLTYSILNKESFHANYGTNLNGKNIVIYLYSVDIFADASLTEKLGTLYPSSN